MFILYDFICLVFILSYLPVYILRRKFHSGFLMRLGFFSKEVIDELRGMRPIWLHAVSVGEVSASKNLIERIHKSYPDTKIVISTVTQTGNRVAKQMVSPGDFVFYLPLDFSFIVKKVIDIVKPRIFIIAETEIWPNLISCLYRQGVPLITVNARISDNSFLGYRLIRPLLKQVLNRIGLFCVQSETDASRLVALGLSRDKVCITGNMKYDIEIKESAAPPNVLSLDNRSKLLVAGSTHPGEEKIILDAYKKIRTEFPGLKLLIAPRHPERANEISRLILKSANDLTPVFISKLDQSLGAYEFCPVFILDLIGQLKFFYKTADIVFVGGSMVKKGGHNILEPAFFAKPIIFGQYMFNFKDMADLFIKNNAAICVKNEDELVEKIKFLLSNAQEAERVGRNAKAILGKNRGATERNIDIINNIMSRLNH